MSLVIADNGDPVHVPKRRDVFEWDAEVASIFDNMALRSIPMYAETHRVHAAMIKRYTDHYMTGYRVGHHHKIVVGDIGASTGAFFKTLAEVYHCQIVTGIPRISAVAFDSSLDMLKDLEDKMPWVRCIQFDVSNGIADLGMKFDVVNLSYILQFLPQGTRFPLLKSIANSMEMGGLLFISQKEAIEDEPIDQLFTQEYIQYRRDNGYTVEEINAKTVALRNAMWVDTFGFTKEMLVAAGFKTVQPTTRWLNFSSLVAVKK
jgi:tRNA (cmo5U34)-methyltransferase